MSLFKLSRPFRLTGCVAALLVIGAFAVNPPQSHAAPPEEADTEPKPVAAARSATLVDILGALLGSPATPAEPADVATAGAIPGSTHVQTGEIKIRGNRTGHQLQTFCLNGKGEIFAVVGPARPYGNVKLEGKNNSAEIRVFDKEGKELRQWTVDFAVSAIAAAPNGNIFVAGNGKIAKFDSAGKVLAEGDAPHIAKLLKDSAKLKEEAEAQLEAEKEQYEEQVKQITEIVEAQKKQLAAQKEKLDTKPEEERTAADKRKIRTLELSIKNQELQNKALLNFYKERSNRTVDQVLTELTGRLKIANALTVSDTDVFLASGVLKGYGYAIWRTSHDFEGAEQIVSGLSGCCGQMDIRCCEDGVFVAENSRKRVLQYDREGKQLAHWGEGDRNGAIGAKFGGCCNPMNLCFGSGGEVLTAESEGFIKRFTKEGSFLGIVGQAKVSGGCKNVAIGVSPDGEKAYFFDLQGSRIVVLSKKPEEDKPATEPADADAPTKDKVSANDSAKDKVPCEYVLNVGYERDQKGTIKNEEPVVFFNERYVVVSKFGEFLTDYAKEHGALPGAEREADAKNVEVIVRADKELPAKTVKRLVADCRKAGYAKFTIRSTGDEK